jgi:hypothetical protein
MLREFHTHFPMGTISLRSQENSGSRPGQENGKTVHEDNIILTVHTQERNNNKYEETGKCGSSDKKHCRRSSACFC